MVRGLDKFREYFSDFPDNYVIIGGTACDLALQDSEMRPRATDDIDMILVVDKMTAEFGARFWQFISDGQYENRQRRVGEDKESKPELFRFINPQNGFPVQIELLSKQPDVLGQPTGFHLTPIPIDEKLSSLSAILLDEEYYYYTLAHSVIDQGVRIADPVSLMCLKARAFLNLTQEKKSNSQVRSGDIKKHRDDVFKLLAMRIDPSAPIVIPPSLRECMGEFIAEIEMSLPNQSLKDSLGRNDENIREYLQIMREIFEIEQ